MSEFFTHWLSDWSTDQSIDSLISLLRGRLTDPSINMLIDCLIFTPVLNIISVTLQQKFMYNNAHLDFHHSLSLSLSPWRFPVLVFIFLK